jgi:tRNA A37 threonylcarbamoyladenosine biosynthesis protein TsaE
MELVTGRGPGERDPGDERGDDRGDGRVGRPASTVVVTTGPEETRDVAGSIARLCVPGDVLLLVGDLGAGKTTFAQGFGAGLGVAEPITSPTFTLVRQYPVSRDPSGRGPSASRPAAPGGGEGHRAIGTLVHADVYRLDHRSEIVDLGLGELVDDGAVALVEWGDAARPVLGDGSLTVHLAAGGDDLERVITLAPDGGAWSGRWSALVGALARWRSAT